MNREKIVVIDFGGQYNQLVARRVRECNVYCEIYSYRTNLEQIKTMNPKGIILTGGPDSCYAPGAASCGRELFELGIPVLGLCYGAQLMMHVLGGRVGPAPVREYGKIEVTVDKSAKLFGDVSEKTICWMSHNDYIEEMASGFRAVARTKDCPVAAAQCEEKNLYAIQFHPEVLHTQEGTKMIRNFLYEVCHCEGNWKMDAFVENSISAIREKVGSGKVLCALSGGVDSSVAAVMLSKAVGEQLTCVFVDHGLLRKNEGDEVEAVFGPDGPYKLNFIRVNARSGFMRSLKAPGSRSRSGRSSGKNLSGCSRRKRRRSALWISLSRELSIRMWWRAGLEESPRLLSPTTMLAVCRIMWISRRSSSLCGICSKMRSAGPGWSWGFRKNWYTASRFPGPGWGSVSSAR